MSNGDLTGLSVEVHRNEDAGAYEFGVVINGVFVVFAARKLGRIDDLRNAAAKVQSAAPVETTPETQPPSQ